MWGSVTYCISASTGYAPFELNYGFMPKFNGGITPSPSSLPGVRQFAETALDNLAQAHDVIIHSHVIQTHYANRKQREISPFKIGDKAYLSTEHLFLLKGRAKKLMPRYIGPYEIIVSKPEIL